MTMKLSEAIRKGCEIATTQHVGAFFKDYDDTTCACALGTAWLGLIDAGLAREDGPISDELNTAFPALLSAFPDERYNLWGEIVNRNDGRDGMRQNTREEIATWLEAMGY